MNKIKVILRSVSSYNELAFYFDDVDDASELITIALKEGHRVTIENAMGDEEDVI